ncbi:unnamed protein product [Darwinula stevensoni]|uniref:Transcription factor Adf-1 n=1 Tax=Darwinula stevensoni TaxID=69355 RepID=A0A7R8XJC2_9CRUS|nr:unnamed protein product [Darwinula stevensoni]CAG0895169.1 unnamed protein product [Darwinula stevensoni]
MDVEALVAAVQLHEVLYNPRLAGYRDRDVKENAWQSVGESMGCPVEQCKKKWKGLRDTFVKEMNKALRTPVPSKWHMHDQMQFLIPHLRHHSGSGHLGSSQDDLGSEMEDQPLEVGISYNDVDDSGQDGTGSGDRFSPPVTSVDSYNARTGKFMNHVMKESETTKDEDEMFLLALLPGMKQLGEQRKDLFKLRVHQMLYEFRYGSTETQDNDGFAPTPSKKPKISSNALKGE